MRLVFFLFLLIHATGIVAAQGADPDIVSPADTTLRPVLLVFAGSDWCQPCIRFEKKVLSDSAFLSFAQTSLNVVKADFPQRKKLLPAQRRENELLAERYNPEGKFPHVVLIRPDGTVLAVLPSDAENGAAFVAQIEKYLPRQ